MYVPVPVVCTYVFMFVCMCVFLCMHVCTTCVFMYCVPVCAYMWACMHICASVCFSLCACMPVCTCLCVCMFEPVCVYVSMCLYMCLLMCMHVCISPCFLPVSQSLVPHCICLNTCPKFPLLSHSCLWSPKRVLYLLTCYLVLLYMFLFVTKPRTFKPARQVFFLTESSLNPPNNHLRNPTQLQENTKKWLMKQEHRRHPRQR